MSEHGQIFYGSEWDASNERIHIPRSAVPVPEQVARSCIMARTAQVEVRILDTDEAKAVINRLRMMTGYARALEQVVHNTYEGELAIQDVTPDEAIKIARDVHGIQPIDLELG